MEPSELRRRLRAARAYGDLGLQDLAGRVELGRNTLIRMENGERNPKEMELRAIATACGLPYEFFTADSLAPTVEPPAETRLEAKIDRLLELVVRPAQLEATP